MGFRLWPFRYVGFRRASSPGKRTVGETPVQQVTPVSEGPRDDGLVYGRIVRVESDGRVTVKFDEPHIYRVAGKAAMNVREMPLSSIVYGEVGVGIPLATVETYSRGLYANEVAKRRGAGGTKPAGGEQRLGGGDLAALASGDAVEVPGKGKKGK